MTQYRFPHSDIIGSKLIDSSPTLIAVNHVLLRCLYVKAFVVCSLVTFYDLYEITKIN